MGRLLFLEYPPDGGGGGLTVFQFLIVVSPALAKDGQRDKGTVLAQDGLAVLDSQEIVGGAQEFVHFFSLQRKILIFVRHLKQGLAAGLGPAEAASQPNA